MEFIETPIAGAYVIEVKRIGDERGFFGRLWCRREVRDLGLDAEIVQSNIGFNFKAGTLRGLHYQRPPHEEIKIVRCPRGAIFDVLVDLRPSSPSYRRWFGIELNQENAKMLLVPRGCATGYLTLRDDTEMYYHATEFFHPQSATGVRYDDPAFGIAWPSKPQMISDNDRNWPAFETRS
jgi:dTDP-4-dehydrorhamnose 3,5-epimerase